MPNAPSTISVKQEAASDAARLNNARNATRERVSRNKPLQPQFLRDWTGPVNLVREPNQGANENFPRTHSALAWCTGNGALRIYWDLADPVRWVYHREIGEVEMAKSPFEPPLKKMTVLVRTDQAWTITITPRQGHRVISLGCFKERIISAMQQDVPYAIWHSANLRQKYEIAIALHRRTGDLPIIPNLDVFAEWKKYLIAHSNNPEALGCIVDQMNEYVTRGAIATRSMTRLKTIDLLGDHHLFAGLAYIRNRELWVMNTTSRCLIEMPHHALPRPNPAPIAAQATVQNVVPRETLFEVHSVAHLVAPNPAPGVARCPVHGVNCVPKRHVYPAVQPNMAPDYPLNVALNYLPPMLHRNVVPTVAPDMRMLPAGYYNTLRAIAQSEVQLGLGRLLHLIQDLRWRRRYEVAENPNAT